MRLSFLSRAYCGTPVDVGDLLMTKLPTIQKHVLSAHFKSKLIYEFICHCESRYLGRTSQHLFDHIKQHVPKQIRQGGQLKDGLTPSHSYKTTFSDNQSIASTSAIGKHLLENPTCASHYKDEMFFVISRGRSPFHLSVLEAILTIKTQFMLPEGFCIVYECCIDS